MNWCDRYDCKSIKSDSDKYGKKIERGDIVAWASKYKRDVRLIDGVVIGFNDHMSYSTVVVKTSHNRVVDKMGNQLMFVSKQSDGNTVTRHKSRASRSKSVHVYALSDRKWRVRFDESTKPFKAFLCKSDALDFAKGIMDKYKSAVIVHDYASSSEKIITAFGEI